MSDGPGPALERLRGTLGRLEVEPEGDLGLRAAGVLALIDPGRPDLPLLLERRSRRLRSHPGQIGLPGGSASPADGPLWRTALRESWEELGVPSAAIEPLGYLEPVTIPHSGFLMVPTVALVRSAFTPVAAPAEVAGWFWLPLRYRGGEVREARRPRRTSLGTLSASGYLFGGNFVWGAARLVVDRLRAGLGEAAPPWAGGL